jgi:ATP synthase protein I
MPISRNTGERAGRDIRRVLLVQTLLIALTATVLWLIRGGPMAGSFVFGGVAALANTLLLLWRMTRKHMQHDSNAGRQLRSFYFSSVERFVVVSLLLVAGIGPLHLAPVALVAGFVVGQVALLLSGFMVGKK